MAAIEGEAELATHRVENQPPGRGDLDLVGGDRPLQDALAGLDAGRSAELAAYDAGAARAQGKAAHCAIIEDARGPGMHHVVMVDEHGRDHGRPLEH